MRYPRIVYAIQHNKTGKIYVGSTQDVEARLAAHIRLLRKGVHHNPYLQKDFDEYGEDFSVFEVDRIETYKENYKEYEWMKKLNTVDPEYGYNKDDRAVRHALRNVKFASGIPEPKKGGAVSDEDEHQTEAPDDS